MPCYKPIDAWQPANGGPLSFRPGAYPIAIKIPCGQCIGCRTDRRKEWALRLVHESRLHSQSCFVTLTYGPDSLPRGSTLVKRHVQLWIKKLRRHLEPRKIRFFAVGEYGDESKRPHYHALIFGWWPSDAQLFSEGGGHRLYTSRTLAALWTHGFSSFGSVTPESCAYTAHYCVKKVTGPLAKDHYTRVTRDGEMYEVIPEFALMSRRPGIGAGFFAGYRDELVSSDHALLGGRKLRIPRYYDKLLERESAGALAAAKIRRKEKARPHRADNTRERLLQREEVAQSKHRSTRRKAL